MFNKGKIDIVIPKTYYAPGDIISGNIQLTLKKPVNARQLCISLVGEHKSTSRHRDSGGRMHTSSQTRQIYDFEQQLDTEKEYSQDREYPFEIKIPADIKSAAPQMPDVGGVLGQGLKIVQKAASMAGVIPFQQIKWYLLAKLDISGGLDVKKKADIIIG